MGDEAVPAEGRRQEQAICPLLFSVAGNMSALPSDKEGLQPKPCQTLSEEPLLPAQITGTCFSQSPDCRVMSPLRL